ncbi:fumarate hydratase C-terminal domain-containing protein [Variovorax paradoxus]|uniref:fumarate hydratase C-terminal domain-containing protein n=1 Tax=Variovorax paradoxus TaxID=34073 RepID=UPI001EEEFFF8|nr:fumarate hydratase C-terminal domain-containing protein [Variovorax paradoxus]UKI08304.1 fumarate hydratase C-terminal domain-containing protein [Variovorax paradoxus]
MLHKLELPLSREKVRELAVGDMVTLDGDITVSIGLPTHQRMAQAVADGQALPVDLRGGAFFHLSTFVRETADGPVPLYMNPSTSTRYNAWMPPLVRGLDLRLTGGKGGLDAACVQALRDTGCVYLSFLGGGAPLLSRCCAAWCRPIGTNTSRSSAC